MLLNGSRKARLGLSLNDLCDTYYLARRNWDKAKEETAYRYKLMEVAKARLIDEMLAQNMRAYPRTDGTLISLRRQFNVSVTKENTDQIREWLIETFGDDEPFVKEVVDKAALTAHLKEMSEHAMQIKYPEFLHVSTRPDVSVRGWTNKEAEED